MKPQPRRGTVPYRTHPIPPPTVIVAEVSDEKDVAVVQKTMAIIVTLAAIACSLMVWWAVGDDINFL